MGNEFGHPEWIDFPREGNGWSYKYARRQWELVDNPNLYYHELGEFDKAMIHLIGNIKDFEKLPVVSIWENEGDQMVAFARGEYIFVFNWNGQKSFPDYGFLAPSGKYEVVLNTDATQFAGFGISNDSVEHFTQADPIYEKDGKGWLKIYLPARSAQVLKKVD